MTVVENNVYNLSSYLRLSNLSSSYLFFKIAHVMYTICIHDDGDVYPMQLFWGRCLKAQGTVGLGITYGARLYNNHKEIEKIRKKRNKKNNNKEVIKKDKYKLA